MKKHVVFMVHGVGEQVPGETVDEFLGGASEELRLSGPITDNTVTLANPAESKDGLLNLFPCHQRRTPSLNKNEELVLAEVHWADISPAPAGAVATAIDLLRLVLGIGYIALDNVQNNVVNDKALVQRLVPLFVWLFYAIIAPLNLFLFVGAISLLLGSVLIDYSISPLVTFACLGLLGGLFSVAGFLRARSARTYMERMLMRGLLVLGCITIGFSVLFASDVSLGALDMISKDCAGLSQAKGAVRHLTCFTGVGVFGLKASWLLAVVLLLVIAALSLPGLKRDHWDKKSIYLAVCSAMLALWMTITVAIWYVLVQALNNLPDFMSGSDNGDSSPALLIIDDGFSEATETLVYGVIALLALAAAAVFVAVRRYLLREQLSEDVSESSDIDKRYGRLILNPWLNIALIVAIAGFVFSTLVALGHYLESQEMLKPDSWRPGIWASLYNWAIETDKAIRVYHAGALTVIAAMGFGMLNYSKAIASVIGVARDVTSYLTRTHRANPMIDDDASKYVFAREIQQRFSRVIEHVIAQEGASNISRITFMTHSQGTVVAALGLKAQASNLPVKPTLVTMGSPLTHIYGHYFSKNYKFDPAFDEALAQWLNIYRRDDFVGTRVKGNGTQAQNFRIRPKGHSHYWSDENVWKIFKEQKIF